MSTAVSEATTTTFSLLQGEILKLSLMLESMNATTELKASATPVEVEAHWGAQVKLISAAQEIMEEVQHHMDFLQTCLTRDAASPPAPSSAPPAVLRAQAFELVDKSGRVRARLGVDDDPILYFFDADGTKRTALGIEDHDPCLYFCEKRMQEIRFMAALEEDGISISLHDYKDQERLKLAVQEDGRPSIAVYDEKGNKTWRAPISGKEEQ